MTRLGSSGSDAEGEEEDGVGAERGKERKERERERETQKEYDDSAGDGNERGKRGSGVRVSSFDPLSPPSAGESRVLSTPVLASIRKSLYPHSSARAASSRLPPSPPVIPTRAPRRGLAGDDRDYEPLCGRLVPLPYIALPPDGGTVVLVSEPRYSPATVTSL